MRIIYIRSLNPMAVQIINQMPDVQVHRGEPLAALLKDFAALRPQGRPRKRVGGRAGFIAATLVVHVIAGAAFLSKQHGVRNVAEPEPIVASLIDAPLTDEKPPEYSPPVENVVFALPSPQDLSFEPDAISVAPAATATAAISQPSSPVSEPPMVDSVEYLRTAPPVYPKESQRRREYGTVILRVLVDALGRPAQVRIERSSGFERLDFAGRDAVAKFLFRPHEVNGIAQPAQVLIPIEFTRRAT